MGIVPKNELVCTDFERSMFIYLFIFYVKVLFNLFRYLSDVKQLMVFDFWLCRKNNGKCFLVKVDNRNAGTLKQLSATNQTKDHVLNRETVEGLK